MNENPRLVDYSLFVKPKPKIVKKLPEISNSVLINIIIIIILLIGGVILYQRANENENIKENKYHDIIRLNEYVKENIK